MTLFNSFCNFCQQLEILSLEKGSLWALQAKKNIIECIEWKKYLIENAVSTEIVGFFVVITPHYNNYFTKSVSPRSGIENVMFPFI